ncbi:MAG: TIGR02757 family protein [Flavobacteriales bacterium]|nr:TIGR02757 family protein [Flavobacteriales bacterium]
MNRKEIKEFLDLKVDQYNKPSFVKDDPIQIPKQFKSKEDIEISGFLTAIIAWGQRVTIINNANKLMELMENSPYQFLMQYGPEELSRFDRFVHRTFNAIDCKYFIRRLAEIYRHEGGLEGSLGEFVKRKGTERGISAFKGYFFKGDHEKRTEKHLADPLRGSSAKRINMFLRWMVRKDSKGVDFGLWDDLPMSSLSLPLDIHTGNVARKLKLLKRKQNDWKSVDELDTILRSFDPVDPIRYDFALFGLGVHEGFK